MRRVVDVFLVAAAGVLVAGGIGVMLGNPYDIGRVILVINGLLWVATGLALGLSAWIRVRDRQD